MAVRRIHFAAREHTVSHVILPRKHPDSRANCQYADVDRRLGKTHTQAYHKQNTPINRVSSKSRGKHLHGVLTVPHSVGKNLALPAWGFTHAMRYSQYPVQVPISVKIVPDQPTDKTSRANDERNLQDKLLPTLGYTVFSVRSCSSHDNNKKFKKLVAFYIGKYLRLIAVL